MRTALLLLLPALAQRGDAQGVRVAVDESIVANDAYGTAIDVCPGHGTGATQALSGYDGASGAGSFSVIVMATYYTGCSPGRRDAADFAEIAASVQAQYPQAKFMASLKGTSDCTAWGDQYFAASPDAVTILKDSDNVLHYGLFESNPQYVIIDKAMVLRERFGSGPTSGGTDRTCPSGELCLNLDLIRTRVAELLAEPDPPTCSPDPCNGDNGACDRGVCTCQEGYGGAACDQCADGYAGYPDCTACVYDCAGTCNGELVNDCAGTCGGSAAVDECGVCGGGGIPAGPATAPETPRWTARGSVAEAPSSIARGSAAAPPTLTSAACAAAAGLRRASATATATSPTASARAAAPASPIRAASVGGRTSSTAPALAPRTCLRWSCAGRAATAPGRHWTSAACAAAPATAARRSPRRP